MDDKKSAEILLKLLEKYPLESEERAAVEAAIGILGWTSLAGSRLKAMKDKKSRDAAWPEGRPPKVLRRPGRR